MNMNMNLRSKSFGYVRPERNVYTIVCPPVPRLLDMRWHDAMLYSTRWDPHIESNAIIGFVDRNKCQEMVYELHRNVDRSLTGSGETYCECAISELRDVMHVANEMLRMPLVVELEDDRVFLRHPSRSSKPDCS